jgi:hypothetical protein
VNFEITKNEEQQIGKWQAKHIKKKHKGNSYSGAIGGRFTYEFTPTSLGDIGIIKCNCGEEFTFRDL